MNIKRIDSLKYTPSFGIKIGKNLQDKILLTKQRNIFSEEQLANLTKIENNGIDAILELSEKYVISSVNKKKGIMKIKKFLCLTDEINKVEIADVSFAFEPTNTRNKFIFHTHKFIRVFEDNFNLAQKVEQAWEKLSKGSR